MYKRIEEIVEEADVIYLRLGCNWDYICFNFKKADEEAQKGKGFSAYNLIWSKNPKSEYEPDYYPIHRECSPKEYIAYCDGSTDFQRVDKKILWEELKKAYERYTRNAKKPGSNLEHELGVPQFGGAYAEDAGIYGWDLD